MEFFPHSPSTSSSSHTSVGVCRRPSRRRGSCRVLVGVLLDVLVEALLGVLVEDLPGGLVLVDVLLPEVVLVPAAAPIFSTQDSSTLRRFRPRLRLKSSSGLAFLTCPPPLAFGPSAY